METGLHGSFCSYGDTTGPVSCVKSPESRASPESRVQSPEGAHTCTILCHTVLYPLIDHTCATLLNRLEPYIGSPHCLRLTSITTRTSYFDDEKSPKRVIKTHCGGTKRRYQNIL